MNKNLPLNTEHLPVIDCGTMEYRSCLDLQLHIADETAEGRAAGAILLVEHPPVITTGIRRDLNRLVSTPEELQQLGISLVPIKRGGGATAHNPGQLVIYPVMHLQRMGFRVAPYVHYLENAVKHLLRTLGVDTRPRARYPGLWAGERKIASVGVQLHHGVCLHGIAVNLWNDLSIFNSIVACGIEGVVMTNANQEGAQELSMDDVKQLAAASLAHGLPDPAGNKYDGRIV